MFSIATATPAAACTIGYQDLIEQNRDGLTQLKVGMTREDLVVLMGDCETRVRRTAYPNPYRIHTRKRGDDAYEILYYLTERPQKFTQIRNSLAVPVVMKNGRVIGWGDAAARDILDAVEGSTD